MICDVICLHEAHCVILDYCKQTSNNNNDNNNSRAKPEMYLLFLGESRDILLQQSRLAQFYRDFLAKALILVHSTELEIFYRDLTAKALILVPATVLEIFLPTLIHYTQKPYFWSLLHY